jgi:DNA-binding response OmpR family regulator
VPITLTAREFSLLEYLMRHVGEVVGRLDLLEHVWESYGASEANVVEVYIGYLRRKIDTPFDRKAITTVRGVGYRLAPDGG